MITIYQFPFSAHSLADLLGAFRLRRFELTLCWQYAVDGSLRLHIDVTGEDVAYYESIITAFLAAHHYQFVHDENVGGTLTTLSGLTQQQYVLSPLTDKPMSAASVLCQASTAVLLMGLRKSNGRFVVRLNGIGAMQLKASVSVICHQGMQPREVLVAFPGFKLSVSDYFFPFDFIEGSHSAMLTLPSAENGALVTGYGEERQAVVHVGTSDIVLGRIFNSAGGERLCLTSANLLSSSCVWGAPGYGKTTLLRSICLQAWRKQQVSFLVVEPKQDYRELQRFIPELRVIHSLRGYNPLLPPRGVDAFNWIEVVIDLLSLSNALPEDSPLPGYLRQVYFEALRHKNLEMGFFLQLYDQVMAHQQLVGQAVNFIISGRNRLENLFRTFCGPAFATQKGRFFDIAALLDTPTVIEIGQVPTASATSLFTYFVAAHVKLHIQRRQSKHITNLLVLEEAHTILNPEMADQRVRFNIANLLAEGRGQGLSVCVVDQTPSRVDPAIGNLCGNIVSLRVVSNADREYVAAQLGTDPAVLNNLRKATALIRTNSLYQPETIHIDVDPKLLE